MSRFRIFAMATALLLVGAFLLWGPIGLGNGPLGVPAMAASFGSVQATSQPTAYLATLVNAGGSAAVIDGVTVTSADGFQPPPASQCVVVTAIVVRYHVGIRHYTATVPQGLVWACGKHAHQPPS